jgi:hypothetical protein
MIVDPNYYKFSFAFLLAFFSISTPIQTIKIITITPEGTSIMIFIVKKLWYVKKRIFLY